MSEYEDLKTIVEANQQYNVTEHGEIHDALDAERSQRIAGDAVVLEQLGTVNTRVTSVNTSLGNEVIARTHGDLVSDGLYQGLSARFILEWQDLTSQLSDLSIDVINNANQLQGAINTVAMSVEVLATNLRQEAQDLFTQYDDRLEELDQRVAKYEIMLQDITMDSSQITMDNGEITLGAWTILSQAREWDLEIIRKMDKYQLNTTEDINQALDDIQSQLPNAGEIINQAIEALSNAPVIKDLDSKLTGAIGDINDLNQDLLGEITNRQNEMIAQAQNTANALKIQADELIANILAETTARIDAVTREADIRTLQIEGINASISEETAERIEEIRLLNDGLTAEVNSRVEGDQNITTALDNYKESNDTALANVRNTVEVLVSDSTAMSQTVSSLDARLTVTEASTATANSLAASANEKATTALTATTSLAERMESVEASIETVQGDLTNKVDVIAFNSLKTEVTAIDGRVTTNTANIASITGNITDISSQLTANTIAISELSTEQTQQGNDIEQVSSQVTQLSADIDSVQNAVANKADASAVASLTTQVNQQGEDITLINSDVTTLKGSVSTIEGNLASKADVTAFNALDSKVTTIDGKVTTNASNITTLQGKVNVVENGLATKADGSALSALTTRVGNVEEGISTQSTALTKLSASLQAQGANLQQDGGFETLTATSGAMSVFTTDKYSGSQCLKFARVAPTGSGGNNDVYWGNFFDVAGGRTYYVEAYVRRDPNETVTPSANTYFTLGMNVLLKVTGTYGWLAATQVKPAALSNTWSKVSGYVTVPNNYDKGRLWLAFPGNTSNAQNSSVLIDAVFITDATEGFNAQSTADATSSALTSTNAEVSRINGVVVAQGSSITNLQAGLITANNNIATKADGSALSALTTRVSNAEGEIASQSNQSTLLTSKLNNFKAAGRNYLLDSKAAGSKSVNPEINTILAPSTPIRMSFDIEIRTPVQAGSRNRIGFECSYAINGTTYYCGVWLNNASSTGAGKLRVYFTHWLPSSWTAGVSAFPSTFPYYNQTSGGDFTVSNIKLEVGDAYTDWTPAPEDNASAAALSTLDTKVVSIDGKVTTQASSITQLQADVAGNSSKLIVQGEVVDGLKASYVIKTDVNGLVTSYGLYNENGVGAFGVNADYFYVGKGTAATNGKKPFMVLTTTQTISGVTYPAGTWIDVALIANATIGSAHIANASINDAHIVSLNASKITAGIINAERIGANSISAEKLMIGDATNLWGNQHFTQVNPYPNSGSNRTRWVTNVSELKGNGIQMWGRDHIAPYSTKIPLKAGDTFVIEYIAGRNGGPDIRLNVGLWTYNINGNAGSAPWQYGPAEQIANLGSGWFRWRRIFVVTNYGHTLPVAYGVLYFQIEQSEYEPNPAYWSVGDVTVRKGVGGELIVNGSVTADKIQVGSLSAISANLGTITTIGPDNSKRVITGGSDQMFYPSGRLAIYIGL